MKPLHSLQPWLLTIIAAVAWTGGTVCAAQAPDALIAKARAFLGGDEALNNVRSLHFRGTLTGQDGKARQIELIVRQPLQQRLVESNGEIRAIMGLDDYTGWRRLDRVDQPNSGRVAVMSAAEVRRVRAGTWHNLYFYRNPAVVDGQVSVAGETTVEGVACMEVAFTHPGGVSFTRYFEPQTGRLVMTKTDDGTTTRERGEMRVAGIRFPKEIVTTSPDGTVSTLVFEEIRVNDEVSTAMFEFPRPQLVLDEESAAPSTP